MSFLDDFQRCNFGQGVLHGDFAKWKNYQLNLSEIWSEKGRDTVRDRGSAWGSWFKASGFLGVTFSKP